MKKIERGEGFLWNLHLECGYIDLNIKNAVRGSGRSKGWKQMNKKAVMAVILVVLVREHGKRI